MLAYTWMQNLLLVYKPETEVPMT